MAPLNDLRIPFKLYSACSIGLVLPDCEPKARSDQRGHSSERPSRAQLQPPCALLGRRDLGEPCLLARKRRLLFLTVGNHPGAPGRRRHRRTPV
jgi:hypothetical protein